MSVSAESESVYVFTPSSGSVQLCTVLHSAQFCTVYTHSAQYTVASEQFCQCTAGVYFPSRLWGVSPCIDNNNEDDDNDDTDI